MKLSVQPRMTQTHDSLTELEAQFADHLELSPEAQDLLFREARTANTFTDEPVTEEQVQRHLRPGEVGPTAFNQTSHCAIVLVRSPEARGSGSSSRWPGQPAEDRHRAARRDPRRRRRVPRGAPEALPALPAAHATPSRASGPRAPGHAQRRAAGRLLHPRCPRGGPGRGPDDRPRRRRGCPRVLPGRRPQRRSWSSTSASPPRAPGWTACPASTTTRSSPPSEPGRDRHQLEERKPLHEGTFPN